MLDESCAKVFFFFFYLEKVPNDLTQLPMPVTSKMYDCPRLSVIWRSDPFTGRGAMLVGLKREFVRGAGGGVRQPWTLDLGVV